MRATLAVGLLSPLPAAAVALLAAAAAAQAPPLPATSAETLPASPRFQAWSRAHLGGESAARGGSWVERGRVDPSSFRFARHGGRVGGNHVVFSTTPEGDVFSVWEGRSHLSDLGPRARRQFRALEGADPGRGRILDLGPRAGCVGAGGGGAPPAPDVAGFESLRRWARARRPEDGDWHARAREGHCYLVRHTVSGSERFGAFRVEALDRGRRAVLDQVGLVGVEPVLGF